MTLRVRRIDDGQHLAFITKNAGVSFLQTPAWGRLKSDWHAQSLGWFDGDQLVGAGLVLLRKVPRVERYLAYLPEGPNVDWSHGARAILDPLAEYCRSIGVFHIKIGPPVWVRRWQADTLKDAIAVGGAAAIAGLPEGDRNDLGIWLIEQLGLAGWRRGEGGGGFGDFQPRYVFQLNIAGRSDDELLRGFNQLWRRNIKRADKEGVTVRLGTYDDLDIFHACYVETAARDGFTPRPLVYFQRMWREMQAEDPSRLTLFIAEHPEHGGAVAATTLVQVGTHAWYSYGASSTAARDLRPSNAIQWAMIRHSRDHAANVYDMRGISDTLDPANHLFGLIQFKLGTGGYAQEYVGEWDLSLSKLWSAALRLYLGKR